ncbi:MAG TPA: fumarylacetoacetase [Phycisphaerales bacterium]|nr:fumarylacetoacetase [Phycisphaerales bacterium]
MLNETHDPSLKSWVESANDPATDFPIQNLPLGAFVMEHDGHRHAHLAVAIGDQVLDITSLAEAGYFQNDPDEEVRAIGRLPAWNAAMSVPGFIEKMRRRLQSFLRADGSGGQSARRLRSKVLRPIAETPLIRPAMNFNYTDFYASIHHATNVGTMFRPDNALLPNYKWVPIGYHGRASSIIPSGVEIRRPSGQTKADDAAAPVFGPCKMLDYELEVGVLVGASNRMGEPVSMGRADHHIAGLCLVNDWSARDMQKWEYQPLGPFLAKNFATTVSPWIVTREALAPFRCAAYKRPDGDPQPLEYLRDENNEQWGGFDITLEVHLISKSMREQNLPPLRVSRGSFRDMYWTFAQMIVHHTSNGCNLQPGDLLASGTVSGTSPDSRGCLLERTWEGTGKPRKPIELPTGEKRTFLEDGDEVVMTDWCEGGAGGHRRIGFGECRGTIASANA